MYTFPNYDSWEVLTLDTNSFLFLDYMAHHLAVKSTSTTTGFSSGGLRLFDSLPLLWTPASVGVEFVKSSQTCFTAVTHSLSKPHRGRSQLSVFTRGPTENALLGDGPILNVLLCSVSLRRPSCSFQLMKYNVSFTLACQPRLGALYRQGWVVELKNYIRTPCFVFLSHSV